MVRRVPKVTLKHSTNEAENGEQWGRRRLPLHRKHHSTVQGRLSPPISHREGLLPFTLLPPFLLPNSFLSCWKNCCQWLCALHTEMLLILGLFVGDLVRGYHFLCCSLSLFFFFLSETRRFICFSFVLDHLFQIYKMFELRCCFDWHFEHIS